MVWLQFGLSALVIVIAGTLLTANADRLSDRLGLGKVWVGAALLGVVTSLPEAGSSVYAVAALGAHDLAAGNVFGSNSFNLVLFVFLDLFSGRASIAGRVSYKRPHFLSAVFAMSMAGVAALEIGLSRFFQLPNVWGMGLGSITLAVMYFGGMRWMYLSNPGDADAGSGAVGQARPLSRICLGLALGAAGVVIGSVWLAQSSEVIAQSTGLGRTFVGSLLLAAVTSFPEFVVTVSALRIGQADLAVGNIFGSNMVNMLIITVCDVFGRSSVFLQEVSAAHLVTIAAGIMMAVIVLRGLRQGRKRTVLGLGWDSWMIVCVYCSLAAALYLVR